MATEQSIGIKDPTGRAPFFRGMRGTLLAWFVLLALVPMALVSIISYTRAQKALTESAVEKLVAIREINKNIVLTNFGRWHTEILFVSQMEALKSDIVDMAAGFNFLGPDRLKSLYFAKPDLTDAGDGSAYSAVHQEEQRFFKRYTKIQQHEDVLLMDPAGNVVYTERKGPDFGASLISGPYQETNLARLYQGLKAAKPGEVLVVDAALFENNVAMFMGTPVYRGDVCLGYIAFQLPLKYLSERMGRREGMGRTGEVYLVGPDRRMRSDSFNDSVNRTVQASLSGTVEQNGVDSKGVLEALAGKADKCIITDYRGKKVLSVYAPLAVSGLQWAILAEVDMEEALAPAVALAKITAGLAAVVALLVLTLSLLASGRIARPIRSLTDWSRQITGGDLTLVEIKTPKNEIGVLNESFREAVKSMRAARSEQERRNWQKTGLSELDDRMRGEQAPDVLCRNIVTFIAKYLQVRVGAFYLDNGDGVFNLKASYAYKTRKNLSNEFKTGEGLIGQAALEKQSILLTNVPDDYIAISSGLGEKPPKNILVIPLVFNELTLGVIELGTFEAFSEDQRNFLEENAERISIALNSAFARQQLQKTLEVSQRQAEELQAQQEELRTSNEEMEEQTRLLKESEERLKTQQEELQVTNEELEEKNEMLERQKREVEEANRVVEEKAAELATASKYKSEFLATMSHELRSPLNSLLLLAQSLAQNKDGNLTDDQIESAGVIYGSGTDLLNLINEILDLSKIEAGRMELQLGTVQVSDLADGVRVFFGHVAEEKGLKLEVAVSGDAPTEIKSDRKRVEQVIRNLVSNALKFTEEGSVTVTFELGARPPAHRGLPSGLEALRAGSGPGGSAERGRGDESPRSIEMLCISVADTGIGIAAEKHKIVFEAFQQADGGTARKYGGTGLGLSISRGLTNLLGGEIQVQSQEGKGSVFTLYLPIKVEETRSSELGALKRGREDSSVFRAPHSAFERSELRTLSSIADDRENLEEGDKVILIIEDDSRFAKVLYDKCHERGFKCLAAPAGEAGLELARKHLPDGIMLDIRLPGMDGWAVLGTLKDDIRTRHIPVHVVSVEEVTTESLRRGAIGHATKPISREELEHAFRKIEATAHEKKKRVLLVEDDDRIRLSVKQLIGDRDVRVDEAATGEQAIKALRATRYGCLILDLGLPDMSGGELLKRVEAEGIELPPVIIHTARELTEQEEMELSERAESIVIKDVRSQERLLDEVSLFLHRVVSRMPGRKKQMIQNLHETDVLLKDKKVLVVDDDMRTTFALSRLLSERGMKALKAGNGEQALQVLEREPDVDLILMDIMMPVMDGYEAIQRIRSAERGTRKVPIIVLTAKAMPEDRQKCIEAGANDYLPKPVDQERLISMMRVWLYR